MPILQCLQNSIKSGSNEYPIYIGFLPAKEILQIAEAPSFSENTPHQGIAVNIMTPPIRDWQRPLDNTRVSRISMLFNNTGEFMPNPVLLSENVNLNRRYISVRQQRAAGGILTNVWDVDVSIPTEENSKPLWILDGQHRINGLASSHQSDNPIPVVILLNEGIFSYSGPLLAKIFAQVTTSATQLDDLHNEWLTFAFDLKDYSTASGIKQLEHKKAMIAVAEMCRQPFLSDQNANNPFFNQIKFNTHVPVNLRPGGFAFNCIDITRLYPF